MNNIKEGTKKQKSILAEYWKASNLIKDERLIKSFLSVPREKFILDHFLEEAYGDYPLPIHEGQTISQPTTVMVMTEALELTEGDKVLEVGAGSGYQAAIIAGMVGKKGKVVTTEIIEKLAGFAKENLRKAGIKNVVVAHYDGSKGYEKEAPYDKIIVTAACPEIPPPLIKQLKPNGILIAPVGGFFDQVMIKLRKGKKGNISREELGYFRFVPLKGEYGS